MDWIYLQRGIRTRDLKNTFSIPTVVALKATLLYWRKGASLQREKATAMQCKQLPHSLTKTVEVKHAAAIKYLLTYFGEQYHSV
jgi:hypothetical protein